MQGNFGYQLKLKLNEIGIMCKWFLLWKCPKDNNDKKLDFEKRGKSPSANDLHSVETSLEDKNLHSPTAQSIHNWNTHRPIFECKSKRKWLLSHVQWLSDSYRRWYSGGQWSLLACKFFCDLVLFDSIIIASSWANLLVFLTKQLQEG